MSGRRNRWAARIGRWLWLLGPLVMLQLGWLAVGELRLDVGGGRDARYLTNFHEAEGRASSAGRWTMPAATLALPAVRSPVQLVVRGAVAATVDGVALAPARNGVVRLAPPPPDAPAGTVFVRQYHLVASAGAPGTTLALPIMAVNPRPGGADPRPVGIFMQTVALQSLGGPSLAPLVPALLVVVLALLLWGLAWLAFGSAPLASGLALVAALALAAGWGWQRLWVAPYLPALALALGWWLGLLALVHWRWPAAVPARALVGLLVAAPVGIVVAEVAQQPLSYALSWHGLPLLLAPLGLLLATTRLPAERAILPVALGFAACAYTQVWAKDWASDFAPLFRGPRALWQGGPLYDLAAIGQNPLSTVYKYPPFFAVVMGPLTALAPGTAFQLWKALMLGAAVVGAGLVWRALGRPLRSWSTLWLALVVLLLQPLVELGALRSD